MLQFASLVPLLQAATGAASSPAQTATPSFSLLTTILPMAALFVALYFIMIRPQNKKQKELKKMLETLKKGDRVITIGGIHGQVAQVKEGTVVVKVDENCKIEFLRSAISTIVSRDDDSADKAAPESDKK